LSCFLDALREMSYSDYKKSYQHAPKIRCFTALFMMLLTLFSAVYGREGAVIKIGVLAPLAFPMGRSFWKRGL